MTNQFKQIKTPRLQVVVQITETTAPGGKDRLWEVHDVERNRGFRITLASSVASATSDGDVARAIGVAVERSLQTPPEKVSGEIYPIELTAEDFRAAAAIGG